MVIEAIRIWAKVELPVEKYSQYVGYQCKGLAYFGAEDYVNAIKYLKAHLKSCESTIDYMYTQVLLYYSYHYIGDKESASQLVQGLDSEKSISRARKCSESMEVLINNLASCSRNSVKLNKIYIISFFYGNIREGSLIHQSFPKLSFRHNIKLLFEYYTNLSNEDSSFENFSCFNGKYIYTIRTKSFNTHIIILYSTNGSIVKIRASEIIP